MIEHTDEPRWLFVSDVDDTLLGDTAALTRLSAALKAVRHAITLVYNSSRPCASLRQTLKQQPQLCIPDYLVGAMGTEIEPGKNEKPVNAYARHLNQGWNRGKIEQLIQAMGLTPHPEEFQTRYKASYDAPDPASFLQVKQQLAAANLDAKIIYSGAKNLDIIPQNAGKGTAVSFLHQWLNIAPERVVVAGDSGNDIEMFRPPYKGIVVGNADAQLKALQGEGIYQATKHHAAGVLEGLAYWGVLKLSGGKNLC